MLAAAVIARMENIPLAVTAAIGLSIFEQSVFFAASRTDIVDVHVFRRQADGAWRFVLDDPYARG